MIWHFISGFTFSFPCKQEGLARGRFAFKKCLNYKLPVYIVVNFFPTLGILTNWTKGFKSSGVEGKDVVELLKKAIDRHPNPDVKIEVCAILNDTTGCLMSCAWKEGKIRT